MLVLEIVIGKSVVSSRGPFGIVVGVSLLVDATVMVVAESVAVPLADVSCGENVLVVVLELLAVIGASDVVATGVDCLLFNVSSVVFRFALLVWDNVELVPAKIVVIEDFNVTTSGGATTEVILEAVLVLEVVNGESVVPAIAVVGEVVDSDGLVADLTVVVV